MEENVIVHSFFLLSRPRCNNCWKYQANRCWWVLLPDLHKGPQRQLCHCKISLPGSTLVWGSLLLVFRKTAKMSKVLHIQECLQDAPEKYSSGLEGRIYGHFCCQEMKNNHCWIKCFWVIMVTLSGKILLKKNPITLVFFFLGLEEIIAENTRPTAGGVAGGYFCIICAKVLRGPHTNVRSHFIDLHWSEAPTYWCFGKQCHKYYTSKNAFRKHLKTHHPDWKGVSLDTFVVKKWKTIIFV